MLISLQTKIEALHEGVVKGDLPLVQSLLTRMKLAVSKDENGHGLLHKAVYHGHRDIAEWLVDKYPETMSVKDWVSLNILNQFKYPRSNGKPSSARWQYWSRIKVPSF